MSSSQLEAFMLMAIKGHCGFGHRHTVRGEKINVIIRLIIPPPPLSGCPHLCGSVFIVIVILDVHAAFH